MIKKLIIKNYAIIDNVEIQFDKGLNIIIGETGAGKSIIINALQLILGERANTEVVRKDKNKAVLEAFFSIKNNIELKNILIENNYDNFDDDLIIRREIFSKSSNSGLSSRTFINDSPAQINFLKDISSLLVDFHNQHDNHSLLKSENHVDIIDKINDISDIKQEYIKNYEKLRSAIKELSNFEKKETELKNKIEFNRFQLEEIQKIDPKENEDEELENKLNILQNSEYLFTTASDISEKLVLSENSIHSILSDIQKQIKDLAKIDEIFEEYISELNSAAISLKEIGNAASDYKNNIEFNPDRIEEIRNRFVELKILQKKYGSVNQAIKKREELINEIKYAENFDFEIQKLKENILLFSKNLYNVYKDLYNKRKKNSDELKKFLEYKLIDLGIKNTTFETNFIFESTTKEEIFSTPTIINNDKYYRTYENGMHTIEFLISTNKGEDPKPLSKIASGGEISRIMLSIKQLIAENDNIPVFVFDEIDTGISGKIAQKVGIELKRLSEKHQIISITHLPQIAALGDKIHVVEKHENDIYTNSNVKTIEGKEKDIEIAKMLSGETITEDSIKSAKQLSLVLK